LIDYSQIVVSNLHQLLKKNPEGDQFKIESGMLRHMILNSIRKNNRQFKDYGQMVICADSHSYWRKQYFPQYKANRKKDRDESEIDWPVVFETLDAVRDELRKYFPYHVLSVPLAEADDIIGVLVKNFSKNEKIMIVSGDKDFIQLQAYPNVEQFAPITDKLMTTDDPIKFLKEHIIQGDKKDGVPNFLSPDDVFVTEGTRQSSIRKAKLEVWLTQDPSEFCDEQQMKNYRRNEKMVDLNQIPSEIQATILEEYAKPIVGDRSLIYGYFIRYRLANLMELIRDF
jgi:5'-3' exonuclease, N-terminal resolvase-like domain/T4 RNase H, C terminal